MNERVHRDEDALPDHWVVTQGQVEGPVPEAAARLKVAYDLLEQLVNEQAAAGKELTGSEVRLALKHRTYDGFDARALGFKRFRDFLTAAANTGRVEVDEERKGDVAVRLPAGAGAAAAAVPAIRGDIWRAFIQWGTDELRLYDKVEDRVVRLPREAAPLEPERFSVPRSQLAATPERYVPIPPLGPKQQLEWMHEFTATRRPNLRGVLRQALDGDKPSRNFVQVLRTLPMEKAAWDADLLRRVRTHVDEWRVRNDLEISIDKVAAEGDEVGQACEPFTAASAAPLNWELHVPSAWTMPSTDELVKAFTAVSSARRGRTAEDKVRPAERGTDSASELRERLHAAIDRMPADELRRLSIPVGYLFTD